MKESDELSEISRAEDILLGALGYSDDAKLDKISLSGDEITIHGTFHSDGEKFVTIYDCDRGQLEDWAVEVLKKAGRVLEE